jgi:tRNA(Met) C34 N-acetyltransferase TmcA
LGDAVDRVKKTLYHGNGCPGLVTQTGLNTQAINTMSKVIWIVVSAVVVQMVTTFFKMMTSGANDVNQNKLIAQLVQEVSALNNRAAVTRVVTPQDERSKDE